MAVKVYHPTSAGRRGMTGDAFDDLTSRSPLRALLEPLHSSGGRSHGRVTVRHRGGGHKRRYRRIDFKRDKAGIPGRGLEGAHGRRIPAETIGRSEAPVI
mgnify:CR=1 FL=1